MSKRSVFWKAPYRVGVAAAVAPGVAGVLRVASPPRVVVASMAAPVAAAAPTTARRRLAVVVPVAVSLSVSVSVAVTFSGELGPVRIPSHPIALRLQAGLAHYAPLFDLQPPGVNVTPETPKQKNKKNI